MGTQEKLKEDLKSSLKGGDSFRVGVLRLVLSELHNREKEKLAKSAGAFLDENEVISVLQKEAKKRREATELFKKGGRDDLVKKEEKELEIIGEYLPQPLSAEEAASFVDKLMDRGLRDFNSLMREAMQELKGKIAGDKLAGIIKEKLK